MEEVTLTPNKNYYLQLVQKHVKLSAPKQSVNTIYAPKGYSIAGYTSLSISNEQYIEIDLDRNTKTWNIINGIPPHNSLTGLQGGAPGQYYHLTQAQWAKLTQGNSGVVGAEWYGYQDIVAGLNTVNHNLGQIPVVVTFWNNNQEPSQNPSYSLNLTVDPDNNFFTFSASKAVANVRIYVRALGTS